MRHQVVAARVFRDERPELRVFDGHLLDPRPLPQYVIHLLGVRVCAQAENPRNLGLVQVVFQPLDEPIKANLSGVRDEAGHGVIEVVFHRLQNLRHNGMPERLSLLVDVPVVAPAEVNPFEAARLSFPRCFHFDHLDITIASNEQGMARVDFAHVFGFDVESGLDDRSFRGHDRHFLVFIPKRRPNPIRVPHHESVAMPDHPAHHITTIQRIRASFQNFLKIEVFSDGF